MLDSSKRSSEPLFHLPEGENDHEESLRRTATFFSPAEIQDNMLRFSFQKNSNRAVTY